MNMTAHSSNMRRWIPTIIIFILSCVFLISGPLKEGQDVGYYALLYDTVDDYVTRRAPFRQEHLKLATEARDRGELVMGGAFTDPADTALLIFRVENRGVVESFARRDPYVLNGLISHWEVRAWNVVIGNTDQPMAQTTAP
jgi:uncharacterized protein